MNLRHMPNIDKLNLLKVDSLNDRLKLQSINSSKMGPKQDRDTSTPGLSSHFPASIYEDIDWQQEDYPVTSSFAPPSDPASSARQVCGELEDNIEQFESKNNTAVEIIHSPPLQTSLETPTFRMGRYNINSFIKQICQIPTEMTPPSDTPLQLDTSRPQQQISSHFQQQPDYPRTVTPRNKFRLYSRIISQTFKPSHKPKDQPIHPPQYFQHINSHIFQATASKNNLITKQNIHQIPSRRKRDSNLFSVYQCESISLYNERSTPKLTNNSSPKKNEMQLSASVESVSLGMIGQKGGESQQICKLPSKVPNTLSEHPELKFGVSSNLNDQWANNVNLKVSSFFRNSPHGSHQRSSLRFKESVIAGERQPNQNLISFNMSFMELKPEKNVIMIDESSSEGNHTLREMKISEKVDIGGCPTSRVEPSDFYQLQQKQQSLEQQKQQLLMQLFTLQEQLSQMKKESDDQLDLMNSMQEGYREKLTLIKDKINLYDEKLEGLQNQLEEQNERYGQLLKSTNLKQKQLHRQTELTTQQQRTINDLNTIIQQLQQQAQINKKQMQAMADRVEQNRAASQEYLGSLSRLQEEVAALEDTIEKQNSMLDRVFGQLEHRNEELQQKKQQLEQKVNELEMMKDDFNVVVEELDKVCQQRQEQQRLRFGITDGFEQLRNIYNQQLNQKEHQLQQITIQNKNLQKEIHNNHQTIQQQTNTNKQLHEKIQILQNNLADCRRQAQQHIELRKQVQYELQKLRVILAEQMATHPRLIVQFEQEMYQDSYAQQLEAIIMKYEKVIQEYLVEISGLQERTYEYLLYAMERQQQSSILYDHLLHIEKQLQATRNQNQSLRWDNQKMKKLIEASQAKISAIGVRLIQAANMSMKNALNPNR